MSTEKLKKMLAVAALLITILMGLAYFTAPVIGTAFTMVFKGLGENLSILTADFSMPMLRTTIGASHFGEETRWWAGAVWAIIIVIAPLIFTWSLRGEGKQEVVERWTIGMSIYLPAVLILFVFLLVGLLLPFTHLIMMQL